ncbi:hypothetical protein [Cytobacillus sp. FSL H8-0458]|uniref:hypothetical protein n=1 Tax=Cytobacillus sp. FSL H8-0458 TaxID=2975346 RepID=UPI0030F8D1FC
MIKNKKLFMTSIVLIFISMALNFPFPHENRLGEAGVMILNIPINSADGIHYIGIFILLLLVLGMVLLHRSLKISFVIIFCRYHHRFPSSSFSG